MSIFFSLIYFTIYKWHFTSGFVYVVKTQHNYSFNHFRV